MPNTPTTHAVAPMDAAAPLKSFAWPMLLLLYLGPGLALTAFYLIVAPLLLAAGLPPVWGLLLGALVVIAPVELGIMLWYSRRHAGRAQMRPAVAMRAPLTARQYGGLVPVALLGALLLPGLAVPLEPLLRSSLFGWLPPWFSAGLTGITTYPPSIQWATGILWIVSVVLIGPIVEELYFRGFLLPRTAHGGRAAPLLNAGLFALYHFWQPYAVLTIALFTLPLAYLVWWRRNVLVSIIAHCVVNVIAFVSLFSGIVQR